MGQKVFFILLLNLFERNWIKTFFQCLSVVAGKTKKIYNGAAYNTNIVPIHFKKNSNNRFRNSIIQLQQLPRQIQQIHKILQRDLHNEQSE